MSGSLLQLLARGVQDDYLDTNDEDGNSYFNFDLPEIKNRFTSHTIRHEIFDIERPTALCRDGDLIKSVKFEIYLPTTPKNQSYNNFLGYELIDKVTLVIGGQNITKFSGKFIKNYNIIKNRIPETNSSLFISNDETTLRKWSQMGNDKLDGKPVVHLVVDIPILFEHKPLPIISMDYHEVKIKIDLNNKLINDKPKQLNLLVEYIYLSKTDQKNLKTATSPMRFPLPINATTFQKIYKKVNDFLFPPEKFPMFELLWHQVQETSFDYVGANLIKNEKDKQIQKTDDYEHRYRTNFNHPLKYFLIEITELDENYQPITPTFDDELFEKLTIRLNNAELVSESPLFYRSVFPQSHSNTKKDLPRGLYFYSFGPNIDHQPSSQLNASRIDNLQLHFKFPETTITGYPFPRLRITIYTENYNILRIYSGMAGLAYAN